jgi:hypothetical protein
MRKRGAMAGKTCGCLDDTDPLARSRTASRPLCDHSSEEEFE